VGGIVLNQHCVNAIYFGPLDKHQTLMFGRPSKQPKQCIVFEVILIFISSKLNVNVYPSPIHKHQILGTMHTKSIYIPLYMWTDHYGWPIIAINVWPIRWRRPMRSNHFLFADLLKPLLLSGCKFTRAHPFSQQCDTILSSKIWHTNHFTIAFWGCSKSNPLVAR